MPNLKHNGAVTSSSTSLRNPHDGARDVFGNERRATVIAILANSDDGAYLSEVAEAAGLPGPTAWAILNRLEVQGFVSGDIPAGRRKGRSVRYSLNREEVFGVLYGFLVDIFGGSTELAELFDVMQADEGVKGVADAEASPDEAEPHPS